MSNQTRKQIRYTYLTGTASCVFFALFSLFFVMHMMAQQEKENMNYLMEVTERSKTAIVRQIEGDFQTLHGVAICITALEGKEFSELFSILKKINDNNHFIRMGILNKEGSGHLLERDGAVYRNIDLSGEKYIQEAMRGEDSISNTQKDLFSPELVNHFAVPIQKDGETLGILCAASESDSLQSIIDLSVFRGKGYSYIVDEKGDPIVYSADVRMVNKENKFNVIFEKKKDSNFFVMEKEEETYWGAYLPIGINGWNVVTVVPRNVLNEKYHDTALGVFFIIAAALFIFLFFAYRLQSITTKNRKILERIAYTDSLTGYHNYQKFLLDAQDLLQKTKERHYALWYCDLKRFKYYNDIFGYESGDRVLKDWADTLEIKRRKGETFGRVNADHFVGLQYYESKEELEERFYDVACSVSLHEEAVSNGYHIEMSGGIFCIEKQEVKLSINEMVNRANMAHRMAKDRSGIQVSFYSNDMRKQVLRETELESASEKAFLEEEFDVYFQPKIGIQHQNLLAGAEALVRWNRKEGGMVMPGEFIPLFEKNGSIVRLDRYMFEHVCKKMKEWMEEGVDLVPISVNVSRIGLFQKDLIDYYTKIKEKFGIPDGLLELEFTESIGMEDYETFCQIVTELKRKGFSCSLDDFGSGYSSLNVLKNLPVDILKLDILFFREGKERLREQAVVANIISMAKELQMKTVAEGIECLEQVKFLMDAGCDFVQGYVFSRPVSVEQFDQILRRKQI